MSWGPSSTPSTVAARLRAAPLEEAQAPKEAHPAASKSRPAGAPFWRLYYRAREAPSGGVDDVDGEETEGEAPRPAVIKKRISMTRSFADARDFSLLADGK